ncbi:MAG: hemin ABC transporter substrate-binding protein, partial [Alphaproteobacteria bacterium]
MIGFRRAVRLGVGAVLFGAATLSGAAAQIAGDPQRVVSIGGAVTEIAYALGQQDRLVAVDATSFYPPAATAKPNVGYMRALSAEGILAMRPDLSLAVEGSGPPGVIDILRSVSVPLVVVPDDRTPEGLDVKIETVAAALGQAEAGRALARQVHSELDAVLARTGAILARKRVLFVMSLTDGRPLGA